MSTRLTVTIPVEAKVREFDEKVALAARLATDGHLVILGPDTSVDAYADERGSDAHFVNGAVPSAVRSSLFPRLSRRGTRILLLDTEGGNQVASATMRARFDPALIPHLYRYLAWGAVPARLAVEHCGLRPEQVVVTGLPRLDLLRPPYEAIHDATRAAIRGEHARFVLLNTNLTRANPFGNGTVRALVQDPARLEHQRALLRHYREVLPLLLERVPGINVIIRPHPGENFDTYRRMFAGEPRIRVRHEGSVQAWIKEAVAVVHNSCFTGVEAATSGTPVIAFTPTGWTPADFTIANQVSANAADSNALVELLAACADGKPPANAFLDDERRSKLEDVVANVRSSAIDAVARIVREAASGGRARRERLRPRQQARRLLFTVLGDRGAAAARRIKYLRDPVRLLFSLQKMSGMTRSEILDRLQALDTAMFPKNFQVRTVKGYEQTFAIDVQ